MKQKNKFGQMKIQQMSFMLLAVLLFFVLVGMIVLVVRMNQIKKDATSLQEESALYLASKLANSPEFSCGSSFGSEIPGCIDMDKVMIVKKNINNYKNFWGVSNIQIIKLYPDSGDIICTNENYPNCDIMDLFGESSGADVSNFVSLCRKEYSEGIIKNKCEIGKILVSYEKK